MVYDNQDRLTLQQDINQRTAVEKGWTFFKYDKFGRMVYSGFFKNTASRGSMQTALNNKKTPNNEERVSSVFANNGQSIYYTNAQFPNGSLIVQSVNYYDHYQNLGVTPSSIDNQNVIGADDTKTKGLAVASYINVLGETTWNKSYTYYDAKYIRPIASHLDNYLGGYQTTASVLDFRGKVKNTVTKHMLAEYISNEITIKEEFDYYPNELLKYQTHQINNNPKEYIVQNSYNEINQLTSKKVGNTNSSTPLQKVDYKYNIRGWLTDINNIDVTETGTYKDLFSFRLNYDKVTRLTWEPQRFKPLYNGNINEAIWKASDNIIRSYNYQYDNLNRLREGTYIKGANQIVNAYNEIIKGYDKNGNIIGITRSGEQDISNNMVWIDDTNYTYQANSNKLLAVTDNPGYKDVGFIDGNTSGNDYAYDANGNLIQDLNKGITKISYNSLSLPTEVLWINGDKISYAYDASGVKLAKYVQKNLLSNVETTYYMNGFQYSQEAGKGNQSVLQFFPTAEGYVNVTNGTAFNYVYNYTDHLGNVRLSYQKNTDGTLKILEENNYYPFGLKHSGYNNTNLANTNYKYKYNGKELQDDFNINLYDYGARNYDPTIGRWFNIDPLAEKYYGITPYSFALNSPILYTDPNGKEIIIAWDRDEEGNINGINISVKGKVIDNTSKGLSDKQMQRINGRIVNSLVGKITYSGDSKDDKFGINITADITVANDESEIASNDHVYRIVDDIGSLKGEELSDDEKVMGFAARGQNYIYLDKNFDGTTAAHETFHSAGLKHIKDEMQSGTFGKPIKKIGNHFQSFSTNDYSGNLMHQQRDLNKFGTSNQGNKLTKWQLTMIESLYSNKKLNRGKQKTDD
ncbi:RHS repeat-associated core domain-containing protein [Empedobacter tilapiae]|uniref:RHS repeat-associated core domain-containing protein n=2 Tax=Empedobacter tilapiae TaxID=2491114 RepID=A0A4Z1AX17_9FLAO|nr:RHS repeat-associated core domain-containing protein [Empedobacter tilapiae]